MSSAPFSFWAEQYSNYQNTMLIQSAGVTTNLTGWSAHMTVTVNGVSVTLSSSGGSPPITLGGTAGTITFNIPPSTLSSLGIGVGKYDLLLTDGSGNKTRLIQGTFIVAAGVTTS